MAPRPVIFACSILIRRSNRHWLNAVRDDLIMGTGRSDYPNQVNNVLCFPFIFRGALDVRASRINSVMKRAAVEAIRGIAKEPVPPEVLQAADESALSFGADYVLPKPMDPRLLPRCACGSDCCRNRVLRGLRCQKTICCKNNHVENKKAA